MRRLRTRGRGNDVKALGGDGLFDDVGEEGLRMAHGDSLGHDGHVYRRRSRRKSLEHILYGAHTATRRVSRKILLRTRNIDTPAAVQIGDEESGDDLVTT